MVTAEGPHKHTILAVPKKPLGSFKPDTEQMLVFDWLLSTITARDLLKLKNYSYLFLHVHSPRTQELYRT